MRAEEEPTDWVTENKVEACAPPALAPVRHARAAGAAGSGPLISHAV